MKYSNMAISNIQIKETDIIICIQYYFFKLYAGLDFIKTLLTYVFTYINIYNYT